MRSSPTALFAVLACLAACSKSTTTPVTPTSTTFTATLNAANETPPTTEIGTGTATFTLTGTSLAYTVTATSLTGPATLSHIHIGPAGVAGPIIVPFVIAPVVSGTVTTGTLDLTQPVTATISGDSLKVLLTNGGAYVNVHTAAHPGGEIRGQVTKKS